MASRHIVTVPRIGGCPVLGIQVPGERPFLVMRDKFVAATRGIKVTDWAIAPANGDGRRHLVITHASKRTHGSMTFYDLAGVWSAWDLKRQIDAYRGSVRKRRAAPKLCKHEVLLAKLQRELRKMGEPTAPYSPLLKERHHYSGNYLRDMEAAWAKARSTRKALARIAGLVLRHRMTDVRAYKQMRDLGVTFKTFGSLPQSLKSTLGIEFKGDSELYWRKLPTVCGLARKPWHTEGVTEQNMTEHRHARIAFLARRNEYRALQIQINDLQVARKDVA